MKNRCLLFVLFYLLFCIQNYSFGEENDKDSIEIFRNIKCLTCNGQSIEESNSDFSKELRTKIKTKIEQGHNKVEIYKEIQKEYGNKIFFTSPDNKNWLVVLVVFVFIFCAVVWIYFKR